MHKIFALLLLVFGLSLTLPATAQSRPKVKAKRAFAHKSESSQGKNNKAHFHEENGLCCYCVILEKTTLL